MAWESYVGIALGAVGTGLGIYNTVKARDRYEAAAKFSALGLDEKNAVRYEVAVTNTGNKNLTVDSVSYWREGGSKVSVPAGQTVAPDGMERILFSVLPDQPHPDRVEVVPHKGEPFTAALDVDQAGKAVLTEVLRRNLEFKYGDEFAFEPGDRQFTILQSGRSRHAQVLLVVGAAEDGPGKLCELTGHPERDYLWQIAHDDRYLTKLSAHGPEEGVSRFYTALKDEGKEAARKPFDMLRELAAKNELRSKPREWKIY